MKADEARAEIARFFVPESYPPQEPPTKEQLADAMVSLMADLTDAERQEMREEFIRDFSLDGLMTLLASMQAEARHDR